MSAERLREAAKVLRERAEGATPGPWAWEEPSIHDWTVGDRSLISTPTRDAVLYGWGYDASGIDATDEDRDYIAMMHPGVGLALADWLDLIATSWSDPHADNHTDLDGWHIEFEESTDTHGLKIADLILGVEVTR